MMKVVSDVTSKVDSRQSNLKSQQPFLNLDALEQMSGTQIGLEAPTTTCFTVVYGI
jgi:hypothetical protein